MLKGYALPRNAALVANLVATCCRPVLVDGTALRVQWRALKLLLRLQENTCNLAIYRMLYGGRWCMPVYGHGRETVDKSALGPRTERPALLHVSIGASSCRAWI